MADNSEAWAVLREQAVMLNVKLDPNAPIEDAAQKVLDAQLAVKAKLFEDYQKAKKVKVLMKRDGFPVEDFKVKAGQTCDVPIDVAKRWLELGVCERADPLPDPA